MRWGGVLLLVFIVFHILHFTIGTVHPGVRRKAIPYHNVGNRAFRNPLVAVFYVVAMAGARPASLSRRVEQRRAAWA